MNLPNKLTLMRIVLVPVYVVLFKLNLYIPALIVFLAASITDYFDGMLARKYNLVTNFGKIMDPLADKILVYAAFCIFVESGIVPAWMLIIILFREFIVAGMRTVAASEGLVIAAAMSGKIKTVLQMIAVILLTIAPMTTYAKIPAIIFLWASLFMTIVSGIEYVAKNKNVFSM